MNPMLKQFIHFAKLSTIPTRKLFKKNPDIKYFKLNLTGEGMVIEVVTVVVMVTTLGVVVEGNLIRVVMVMENSTIGSLRNNLIVLMKKGTNASFGTTLPAVKFKPIIQILFPLLPLIHLLLLLVSSKLLYPRSKYLVPQLHWGHNLFSQVCCSTAVKVCLHGNGYSTASFPWIHHCNTNGFWSKHTFVPTDV